MPNGLIHDDSLRAHPDGLALRLTIPWYRSLWLSSVSTLALTVDGEPVAEEDLSFELGGRRYALAELPQQSDVLWYLQEHPLLIAKRQHPVALGEEHDVVLHGELRLPYMQIAPGQDGGPGMYVPNVVHDVRHLTVVDRDAASPALVRDVPPPPAATDADPFKLGLTLYSASAEFRAGWFDFDGLLDRVAELGIGPGIEIVASQVLPTYPVVSDEFVRTWRAAFDKHGFDESSFGANLDMGRRRDRDMTPDEEFEFSELLFQGAKKLGFPLVRIQSAKPELLRRLLPVAEQLELQLAYEIHAPMGPNAEPILKVRDTYAELDSPLLGFVADFSSTMHSMSPTLLRAVQRAGLDDEALRELQAIWATDASMRDRQQEFIAYLEEPRLRPGPSRILRAPRVQHARARRSARVGRHHAADQARPREVLRHRRERPGAGDRLPRARPGLRRGRLPRLLVERVGGSRLRRARRSRPAAARPQAARPHPAVDARGAGGACLTTPRPPHACRSRMPSGGSPRTANPPTRAPTSTPSRSRAASRVSRRSRPTDIRIDGPGRRLVPARLYRDASAEASGRALVWVHGGAFIGGHLDMPESNWVALELAARGIPVLAVDYVKCLGDVHFPAAVG